MVQPKQCPWCGYYPTCSGIGDEWGWRVSCTGCDSRGPSGETAEEAIESWNEVAKMAIPPSSQDFRQWGREVGAAWGEALALGAIAHRSKRSKVTQQLADMKHKTRKLVPLLYAGSHITKELALNLLGEERLPHIHSISTDWCPCGAKRVEGEWKLPSFRDAPSMRGITEDGFQFFDEDGNEVTRDPDGPWRILAPASDTLAKHLEGE